VGSIFDDALNTASTPAFTLFDAALHYDSGHWRFALNGNHRANKKYVATCSSGCADSASIARKTSHPMADVASARAKFDIF
jgi:hypothetical protein